MTSRRSKPERIASSLLSIAVLALALPAAAQTVDPNLVGMWRLQWAGPDIFWQVRDDGVYRLIGTGVRPNDHWGRMQASGGEWSSEWELGIDGGTYELRGNSWLVTGALGTGTWVRFWPGGEGSAGDCPYFAAAAVERLFASAVRIRMLGETCEFSVTKVGAHDELKVLVEAVDPFMDSLRGKRADCAAGAHDDPQLRCLSGLGDNAFFWGGNLWAYRGNDRVMIDLAMHPESPLNDADSIALARIALGP